MMILWMIFSFSYFCGLVSFCFNRKHFLLMLLSLEYIVISLFMIFMLILVINMYNMYMSLVYMIMSVCEGVLGLSILVALMRSYGNDYFQSFSILW
uniref:NADH-ubiquinone oxidoreductase chain 4L n=1 Tax=Staphylinoidea sp. 15 KM-2017 TaxID=2219455 RepID=A0A346RIC0_9COLE|nr:NADH dehydrogenase subunit 4L [Staphylinoidea sp. 15 KM-2017]